MVMKTGGKIQVIIIDNQEIVRLGVRTALESNGDIEIVAEGATETDALHLAKTYRPDVLVLGLNGITMPKLSNRVFPICDTIRHLVKNGQSNVLVLSRHAHRSLVYSLLDSGASGFLLKDEAMNSGTGLSQAIMAIARKKKLPLSQSLHKQLYLYGTDIEEVPQLTKRRVEIMQAIVDNPHLTLAEVADLIGIAESTLRNNLSAVSRALDTPNANGAMIECLRLGLVQISQYRGQDTGLF